MINEKSNIIDLNNLYEKFSSSTNNEVVSSKRYFEKYLLEKYNEKIIDNIYIKL